MTVERGAIFLTWRGTPAGGWAVSPVGPFAYSKYPGRRPEAVRARDFENRASEPLYSIFCDPVSKNGFLSSFLQISATRRAPSGRLSSGISAGDPRNPGARNARSRFTLLERPERRKGESG